MSIDSSTGDEFGGNRLLSRLNRRLSVLLPSLLRLPENWDDNPTGRFKRHLARVNLLALSVLTAGGIIAAVLMMIFAIREDSSSLFFTGVGILPAVFLVQYVLSLFCSANLNLAFSTKIHLVSRLVPDVITVGSFIGLIAIGISGIFSAISAFDQSLQQGLILTMAAFCSIILFAMNAWVAANSERLLDVSISPDEKQGPADYLFSLILYFGRYQLVLVSYQFLASMILAAFGIIYFGITEFVGDSSVSGGVSLDRIIMMTTIGAGAGYLVWWTLLTPMIAHFAYLLFVSIADIGVAFFRLVKGTERIARLSEAAMAEAGDGPEGPR